MTMKWRAMHEVQTPKVSIQYMLTLLDTDISELSVWHNVTFVLLWQAET